jgi:hypothetical protein
MAGLLSSDLALINLGLAQFADGPMALGAPVVAVDWQPTTDVLPSRIIEETVFFSVIAPLDPNRLGLAFYI